MNAIRIRKKLDSEILSLPELRPLLGQTVEIIVLGEESSAGIQPGTGDWTAFARLAHELSDYDFGAQGDHDRVDLQLRSGTSLAMRWRYYAAAALAFFFPMSLIGRKLPRQSRRGR